MIRYLAELATLYQLAVLDKTNIHLTLKPCFYKDLSVLTYMHAHRQALYPDLRNVHLIPTPTIYRLTAH